MTRQNPEAGLGLVGTVGHEDAIAALRRPAEPYRGVRALMNGDLNLIDPTYAPRWDWIILDAHTIQYVPQSREIILYCGHDWSLTGAEGPIVDLRARGRDWPILWTCDTCGATVLQQEASGWLGIDLDYEVVP